MPLPIIMFKHEYKFSYPMYFTLYYDSIVGTYNKCISLHMMHALNFQLVKKCTSQVIMTIEYK